MTADTRIEKVRRGNRCVDPVLFYTSFTVEDKQTHLVLQRQHGCVALDCNTGL